MNLWHYVDFLDPTCVASRKFGSLNGESPQNFLRAPNRKLI